MNFNNVFRWHLPFLFLVLLTFRAAAADTLLILGDSLSAGYRMSASAAWPALLRGVAADAGINYRRFTLPLIIQQGR
ncbi:hypothetical protein ACUN9Z_07555, partial [Escherichia sp. HC-CC4]